jgi:hypothetical protein
MTIRSVVSKLPRLWSGIDPQRSGHDQYHDFLNRALNDWYRDYANFAAKLQAMSMTTKAAEFTSSGAFTWTVPAGVTDIQVTLQAAGASGNKVTGGGQGAGSGECVLRQPMVVTPGAVLNGSIGAGGAAVSVANTQGNAGGNTSFNGLTVRGAPAPGAGLNVSGAGGGTFGAAGAVNGVVGSPGTSQINDSGGSSGGGAGAGTAKNGGAMGAWTGGVATANCGGGAASFFANGGPASEAGVATPATVGAGGGGTNTGTSGKGGDGYCIIEWAG